MQEKADAIKRIWNVLWLAYKEYLADHDMRAYSEKAADLSHECKGAGEDIHRFCGNLIISWAPVMSGLAEDFRNGGEAG